MHASIDVLLDDTYAKLRGGHDVPRAVDTLVRGLHAFRERSTPSAWEAGLGRCQEHALHSLLLEDPFTRRSVTKPRGYAGDAKMLDHIYRGLDGDEESETSALGRAIFGYTAGTSPSAVAVRRRRDLLVSKIDEVATTVAAPRVLSVACGHLREAHCSEQFTKGNIEQYVALDQDPDSLDVVARELGHANVTPVRASVRDINSGRTALGEFDLVYAAGLYDYLEQPVARKLTQKLFGALRPGGRLLVGNFVRGFGTAEYMAAFMDWVLRCRSEEEMNELASEIPPDEIGSRRVFLCDTGYIVYLEVRRA